MAPDITAVPGGTRLIPVPLAAVTVFWAAGAAAGVVPSYLAALLGLWAAVEVGGLVGGRRGRVLPTLLGGALWLTAAGAGVLLARPWARAVPVQLSAVAHWVVHGTVPLLCATVVLAAGGWAFGRLTTGRSLRPAPDIVHWMLGACVAGLTAAIAAPVLGLLGGWAARAGLAALAAASGAFWPAWAQAESAPAPPLREAASPVRLRLVPPSSLPRASRSPAGSGKGVPAAASLPREEGVVPGLLAAIRDPAPSVVGDAYAVHAEGLGLPSAADRGDRNPHRILPGLAGPPAAQALPTAILPRARGARRRRRSRWRPPDVLRWWRAVRGELAAGEPRGVAPMAVRLVSAAANTRRLLGLYAYAGLLTAPALWLLLLGPARAGAIWAAPGQIHWTEAAAILGSEALVLLACLALAMRSGLLHRLELTLPTPSLSAALAAGVAAAALLAWGGPHGRVLGHGLSGALLAGHHHVVVAVVLVCLILPAMQGAFFFGLIQTRLAEIAPVWQAVVIPAALFALSAPLSGVPLPALIPALLAGLLLAWSRRTAGLPWTVAAMVLGNVAGLVMSVVR